MAITGPSATMFSSLSVTTVAISMITSLRVSSPVISRSIQMRWLGFCAMFDNSLQPAGSLGILALPVARG